MTTKRKQRGLYTELPVILHDWAKQQALDDGCSSLFEWNRLLVLAEYKRRKELETT